MIRTSTCLGRGFVFRRPLQKIPFRRHNATAPATTASRIDSINKFLFSVVNIFIAGHLFTYYCYTVRYPIGPSMLPTLNLQGDCVVVSRFHRRGNGVAVGDIVSFHHPMRQGHYGIKRVVGISGDFVLRDSPDAPGDEGTMIQVPEGHAYVVGDNLPWSRDSRHFGPVPLALIRGKVVLRLYSPFTYFGDALDRCE